MAAQQKSMVLTCYARPFLFLLPAACYAFIFYSFTTMLESYTDTSTGFLVVPSFSFLTLRYFTMKEFGKAFFARDLVKRDSVKLVIWSLAVLFIILVSYRVTFVLRSPVMMGAMWGIAAVSCLVSWNLLFLLPKLHATNNEPRRPNHYTLHRLFPVMLYSFMPSLYFTAVWQSHGDPATILFVASSLTTLGLLYLTNQMQQTSTDTALNRRHDLRISISTVATLLNFIFGCLCIVTITPTLSAAAEPTFLFTRAFSILESSFNTVSQLVNSDCIKVLFVTASNLSLLGFLVYLRRQAERPVAGHCACKKGLKILACIVSFVFFGLCFVRAPSNVNAVSQRAHRLRGRRQLPLPRTIHHHLAAVPRGRGHNLVDHRLLTLRPRAPPPPPCSRTKLERVYWCATSRLQAQHNKHPSRRRHEGYRRL